MWEIYDTEREKTECILLHCPNCNEEIEIPANAYLYKYCPYCGYDNGNNSDLVCYNMPNKYEVLNWKDL